MKKITRIFVTGLAVTLPLVATVYLIVWIALMTEHALDNILRFILPETIYIPGLGIGLGILLVFSIGLLMHTWLAQQLFERAEGLMYRLPLVKSIYGVLRDFFNFLSRPQEKGMQQVVQVRLGDNLKLLGFVTRNELTVLPPELGASDAVAVYLPFSYQIGGFTVLLPRAAVQPVNMTLEEAMRFILTAGLSAPTNKPSVATP